MKQYRVSNLAQYPGADLRVYILVHYPVDRPHVNHNVQLGGERDPIPRDIRPVESASPYQNQDPEWGVHLGTVPRNPEAEETEGVQLGTVPSCGKLLANDRHSFPQMQRTMGVQLGTIPIPNPYSIPEGVQR
eukprot:957205-Karenia_brevis.AAC.1